MMVVIVVIFVMQVVKATGGPAGGVKNFCKILWFCFLCVKIFGLTWSSLGDGMRALLDLEDRLEGRAIRVVGG
jgi:hypothetical protein